MTVSAHRILQVSLVALVLLVLFAVHSIASQTHTVRRGDTLYHLSQRYGVSVSAIQSANGLNSSLIRTGQVLSIPSNTPTPPTNTNTYGRSNDEQLEVIAGDEMIAVLSKDTRFIVMAREDGRFRVKLGDGRIGWVKEDGVTLEDPGRMLPASESLARRHDIVRTALAYRGSRYRRGGSSSSGFDCSGFVKYVYAKKGIQLPHDSRAQFNHGKPVPKSELQSGDVVFFQNTYRRGISHVGIYIGDNKFVHAATRATGVRVDDLDASYYARRWAGARRLD